MAIATLYSTVKCVLKYYESITSNNKLNYTQYNLT